MPPRKCPLLCLVSTASHLHLLHVEQPSSSLFVKVFKLSSPFLILPVVLNNSRELSLERAPPAPDTPPLPTETPLPYSTGQGARAFQGLLQTLMRGSWTEPCGPWMRVVVWRVGRLGAHSGQPAVASEAAWWGGPRERGRTGAAARRPALARSTLLPGAISFNRSALCAVIGDS